MNKHFKTKMIIAAGFFSNRSNDLNGIANHRESYALPQNVVAHFLIPKRLAIKDSKLLLVNSATIQR